MLWEFKGKQVLNEPGNGFLEKVEWMMGVSGGDKLANLTGYKLLGFGKAT